MRELFAAAAALALVLTLVAFAILGRDSLAERFPAAMRMVCDVLGCRFPPNANFELLGVESSGVDSNAPAGEQLHLDVVYRRLDPSALKPRVDVVIFDEREIVAHAVVQIVEPRIMSVDVRVATIALPIAALGRDVGFEVTLR